MCSKDDFICFAHNNDWLLLSDGRYVTPRGALATLVGPDEDGEYRLDVVADSFSVTL